MELQTQIWNASLEATRSPDVHPDAGKHFVPALNAMIDITNTRTWAAYSHPPAMVYAMLFVVALICSLLAGVSLAPSKPPPFLHMAAFASLFLHYPLPVSSRSSFRGWALPILKSTTGR